MILRTIVAFLVLPAVVAGVLPLLIFLIPSPVIFQTGYGGAVMIFGGIILLVSVWSFYVRGKGTPAPWDPPKHLVVQDLYRFTRNPMYIGVLFILIGWALATGRMWHYAYGAWVAVFFHLRVVYYEEKEMMRLFGKEWDGYRTAVPRWGIAVKPYRPGDPPRP